MEPGYLELGVGFLLDMFVSHLSRGLKLGSGLGRLRDFQGDTPMGISFLTGVMWVAKKNPKVKYGLVALGNH